MLLRAGVEAADEQAHIPIGNHGIEQYAT